MGRTARTTGPRATIAAPRAPIAEIPRTSVVPEAVGTGRIAAAAAGAMEHRLR